MVRLNNTLILEYLNTPQSPYYDITKKKCCKCGINGSSKRYKLTVKYSYRTYMCAACINQIGSMNLALQWTEQNIHCDKHGRYWFETKDKVEA